jgi:outer membrane protein assembly factor BamB
MRTARELLLVLPLLLWTDLRADDWPMAGGDPQRSGRSRQDLPSELSLRWTVRPAHPPMPAWPTSDRLTYDRANVPVAAGGRVFVGSSADGTVRALDAATGRDVWTFYTGAPVRFAPALWKDRLFAVSDDGHLYCLQAADGRLLWKKRGGPADRWVLGNDRLISHWPARGGPVVEDETVYFAAGIWPSDGIYLYALDAATGRQKWCNDQSGAIYMAQPHGGANAESGISAQGSLVIAGTHLLVPTGRAVPAAFNRSDGEFKYFHLQQNGSKGGAATLAVDSLFINGGLLFDVASGAMQDTVGPGAVAVCPEGIVRSTDKEVGVLKIVEKDKIDRKGDTLKVKALEKLWTVSDAAGGSSVLSAGSSIVSGGAGRISLIDTKTRKTTWSAPVEGGAAALAVADGRLYVSTDRGVLHCFGAGNDQPVVHASPPAAESGSGTAAQAILQASGVTEGYAVDLGCGDGSLALELARRSKLQIYAVDADGAKVAEARRRLEAAGLYGARVMVYEGDPAGFPFPKSFASLVVSGRSLTPGAAAISEAAVLRVQRPYGGVACLGPAASMKKTVRGALEGAGTWTHQYADPANTSCSADGLVRGPLTLYWFRDCDFEMAQRHGRGPAPLYLDGRMFIEGLNGVRAADAYTGRTLWDAPLPKILKAFDGDHLMGTAGTGSNLCVTADGVYVRTESRCLRLDLATGKKLGEFEAPALPDGKKGIWGYVACENGVLFGSLVNRDHVVKWTYQKADMSEQFTESMMLFGLDALTGKVLWTQPAAHSFRHNAIAVGAGRLFAIDRPIAEIDRLGSDPKKPFEHLPGELLAIDAATGKIAWRSDKHIFGTMLVAGVKHDALLMSYQSTRFKLPSEKGGELAVVRMSDGTPLWSKKAGYQSRPSLVDRTIYAQGGAWDLITGDEQKFDLKRSYGCGQLACSSHLAVYRSATLGYTDFSSSKGTSNYGGIRLGCWINAIPAGGLVLAPDATTGCRCSYLNQAWIALQPKE